MVDTKVGYLRAEAARKRGDPLKYYDYDKAKKLVTKKKPKKAGLFMNEDRGWTYETIYENGKWITKMDNKPEIAGIRGSIWATPMIELDNETQECWTWKKPKQER